MNCNDITLTQLYLFHKQRLYSFVVSLFEWSLPAGCNGAILERDIITHGCAGIFWEPRFSSFINTKLTTAGNLDIYGIPKEFECIGINYNRLMPADKIAVVYSTLTNVGAQKGVCGYNVMELIQHYARLLALCDVGIRNEIINTTHPCVITVSDKNHAKSAVEAWRQAKEGEPVVIVDKEIFSGTSTSTYNLDRSCNTADKLATKRTILNDFLSDIGVDSMVYEKSERLTEAEGEVNKDFISLPLQNMLAPRLAACKKFFELYGVKITCKPRNLNAKELYLSYGINS